MLAGLTLFIVAVMPIVYTKMPLEEDMFLYWRRSEGSECEPFTTYNVECNKCVCNADGVAYCTRMACFFKELKENPSKHVEDDRKQSPEDDTEESV